MADLIFNISLGRVAEFYVRVDTSDPTNATFEIFVLATAGIETDAVLRDKDDMAAVVAGATNEVPRRVDCLATSVISALLG